MSAAEFKILANRYTTGDVVVLKIIKEFNYQDKPVFTMNIEKITGESVLKSEITFNTQEMKQISEAINLLIQF